MQVGMIVVWVTLVIYIVVLFKRKITDRKDKKWVYLFIALALGCSILLGLNISLNFIVTFLNNTFGKISRMVVMI